MYELESLQDVEWLFYCTPSPISVLLKIACHNETLTNKLIVVH